MTLHAQRKHWLYWSVALLIGLLMGMAHARGASWYVDKDATGANTGVSWANAWQTFSAINWAGMAQTDTLYISGGTTNKTYTASDHEMFTIGRNGASATQCFTVRVGQDEGHNGTIIFDGLTQWGRLIKLAGGYWVTLNGLVGTNIHWECRNACTNDAGPANPYPSIQWAGFGCDLIGVKVLLANNGISTSGNSNRIIGCFLDDMREIAGVSWDGSNPGYTNYDISFMIGNHIRCNVSTMTGLGPDFVQGCPGLTIVSNVFEGVPCSLLGPNPQHCDFVQAASHYVKVHDNVLKNPVDGGLDFDGNNSAGNIRIWNNFFHIRTFTNVPCGDNGQSQTIRIYTSSGYITNLSDVHIYNNTVVDGAGVDPGKPGIFIGFFDSFDNPTVSDVHVVNNLVKNCGNANFAAIGFANGTNRTWADWDIRNNLIEAGVSGNTNINFGGTQVAQSNNIVGAPVFVKYDPCSANNDLHLATNDTVASVSGVDLSAYFDKDAFGNSRTVPWSVGAHEMDGGASGEPAATNRVFRATRAYINNLIVP